MDNHLDQRSHLSDPNLLKVIDVHKIKSETQLKIFTKLIISILVDLEMVLLLKTYFDLQF